MSPDSKPESKLDSKIEKFRPSVVVIGSSTGGPSTLDKIFTKLKGIVSVPILVVQHMPPGFTAGLAKRLESCSGIPGIEGRDGMSIESNHIYVAPGDYHMVLDRRPEGVKIKIHQESPRNSVRPSVDYLFESAAEVYRGKSLGVILTGMGSDGLIGVKAIRAAGGMVAIQDKKSSMVFGMAKKVFEANEYDFMASSDAIGDLLRKLVTKF